MGSKSCVITNISFVNTISVPVFLLILEKRNVRERLWKRLGDRDYTLCSTVGGI